MANMLADYLEKVDFDSYEDFMENFKIKAPENFNFAFDVVDRYAEFVPNKRAMVWCNDDGEAREFTFLDLKYFSNKAANVFREHGIRKGDYVMLSLKSRYDFWFCMIGLHKIGAIPVPG
ncbi:MAG TPA: AMP-binding protein, partial [Candidatus Methanofastidiosa archaeon]|nr:AMP-binding protein [Candidatus Methanofastidiosa archaeon]